MRKNDHFTQNRSLQCILCFLVILTFCLETSREKIYEIVEKLLLTEILWESFSTFSFCTFFWKKKWSFFKMLCIYAHFCCDWPIRAFSLFFSKMRAFSRKKHFWVTYTFGFSKMIIFGKKGVLKKKSDHFLHFFFDPRN